MIIKEQKTKSGKNGTAAAAASRHIYLIQAAQKTDHRRFNIRKTPRAGVGFFVPSVGWNGQKKVCVEEKKQPPGWTWTSPMGVGTGPTGFRC